MVIAVFIVFLAAAVGLTSLTRPAIVGVSERLSAFSAERAMKHVQVMAQRPHPPGSEEIAKVRRYIISSLESLGISHEIQYAAIAVPRGSTVVATSVQNIVARIPGSDPGSALLLDAHYDTRAMTPGASDCSSGLAVLLETARALGEGPQLRNDVILLFTDNEEYGAGLGAAAFVKNHSLAKDVRMVLNFEGLGATGPSILFETGPNSRSLVKSWSRSAPAPVGQSWFQEIYRLTPIGTDFNWFSDIGVPGLNFAHWARSTVYHTELDTPESIDPRSLQHTGSYALALVNHFGNENLIDGLSKGNSVYFTLFRGLVVDYPTTWAIPLSIVVSALLIGVIILGARLGRLRISGILKGLSAAFLAVVLSAGGATGIWMGIVQLHPEYQAMFTFRGAVYNGQLYILAFAAFSVSVAILLTALFRRKTRILEMTIGAMSFLCLLSIATSILFPGFSYLFTWPALFYTFAVAWVVCRRSGEDSQKDVIPLTIGAATGVMLLSPAIYVMFHFAPSAMIGGVVFMIAIAVTLLVPLWNALAPRRWWISLGATAAVFVLLTAAGSLTARFTPDRPGPSAIAYLQNEDDGSGTWFTAGTQRDEWTSRFVGSDPDLTSVGELMPIESNSDWFPTLAEETRYAGLAAPEIEVLDVISSGDGKTVRLRVLTRRNAPVMVVEVQPYRAVRSVEVAGSQYEPPESSRNLWRMTYYAVPPDGFELTLDLDTTKPVVMQVSDRTWDVAPDLLNSQSLQTRGADMMRTPNFDYGTIVVKTQNLQY